MPSHNAVTVQQLSRRIGLPDSPTLVDVRLVEDVAADPRTLPASQPRSHGDMPRWSASLAGRDVVVICQRGLKLSEGVAAWLRHGGVRAAVLEGGFNAWRDAGLALLSPAAMPSRDAARRTVWVTRARPKVDRIACPWPIRRFVDPGAIFLFVAASLGLSRLHRDDLAQLDAGLALYDAFHLWCRDATEEVHNWPAQGTR